jgi:ABC-type Fe3+-hydroxamate transport system substrate-binding protein
MQSFNDALGASVDIPDRPQRIVTLVSSATEAVFAMGSGHRVVGVSCYCHRYVESLTIPVVGDYLSVDWNLLHQLAPDLVLVTTGLQRQLGLKLLTRGYPVYALPLPLSLCGILENIILLGGLLNDTRAARHLRRQWEAHFFELRQAQASPSPWVYAELWFGKNQQTIGGLSFISDLIASVGGKPLFRENPRPYLVPDLTEVAKRQPDIVIFFSEPEFPVDGQTSIQERGWDRWPQPPFVIESTITKGRNLIHDGISLMETASWLSSCFQEWATKKMR